MSADMTGFEGITEGPITAGVLSILETVEGLGADATGALLYPIVGKGRAMLLIEAGRVCWAAAPGMTRRLTDLLRQQRRNPLPKAVYEEAYRRCQKQNLPLGETLVKEGLATSDDLRRALRQHSAEALAKVADCQPGPPKWVAHNGSRYDAKYAFPPAVLLVQLGALSDIDSAISGADVLWDAIEDGARGLAFRATRDDLGICPVAQVDCEAMPVQDIIEAGRIAKSLLQRQSLDVAHQGRVAFGFFDGRRLLTWTEKGLLFVRIFGESRVRRRSSLPPPRTLFQSNK